MEQVERLERKLELLMSSRPASTSQPGQASTSQPVGMVSSLGDLDFPSGES